MTINFKLQPFILKITKDVVKIFTKATRMTYPHSNNNNGNSNRPNNLRILNDT